MELCQPVTNKRAKIVIDHILEHGFITTEELEETYGYKQAPRAVRDVRELGIPIDTYPIKSSTGKSIAAYRFGDLSRLRSDKLGGRRAFSKAFKTNCTKGVTGSATYVTDALSRDTYKLIIVFPTKYLETKKDFNKI